MMALSEKGSIPDQQRIDSSQDLDSEEYSLDQWELLDLLWDLQEVSQPWKKDGEYKGISDPELWINLDWTETRFNEVKKQLLSKEDSGVIVTPSGGLAYTW